MHSFDYSKRAASVLDAQTVKLLCEIHELSGKLRCIETDKPDVLIGLTDVAKKESTASSVRLQGYETTAARLKGLMAHQIEPRDRAEREILGYGEALGMVYDYSLYMQLTPDFILQLYGDMQAYVFEIQAGVWRTEDTIRKRPGRRKIQNYIVPTLKASDVPELIGALCEEYESAMEEDRYDPLLLMAFYHLDFLCIRPFPHENGKMARLILMLQLLRRSCFACKYISMDRIIEDTDEAYFESIRLSGNGWLSGEQDDLPFVHYFLGAVLQMYREFDARVSFKRDKIQTKTERIRNVINATEHSVSKADIMRQCPDISMTMVEKTLGDLMKEQYIEKIGGGRGTLYRRRDLY